MPDFANIGIYLHNQLIARTDARGYAMLPQLLAYQVIREALNNAVKHARATSIMVKIRSDGGGVQLSVEDDGVGFEKGLVDREAHFGLQLIAERVGAAGGKVLIDSVPGRGTTVVASIPDEIY